jgi:hypothetical protein
MKKAVLISSIAFVVLFIFTTWVRWMMIFPTTDEAWTLSPVFSNLRGNWLGDDYAFFRYPFLYSYLLTPWFYLFGGSMLSLLVINSLLNILICVVIYQILSLNAHIKTPFKIAALCLILCVSVSYSMRPEHLMVLLLLMVVKMFDSKIFVLIATTIFIGFTVPIAGFFATLLVVQHLHFAGRKGEKYYFMGAMSVLAVGVIIYLYFQYSSPLGLLVQTQLDRVMGLYRNFYLFKYLTIYSLPLWMLLMYIYVFNPRELIKRELSIIAPHIILVLLLGKDYYAAYLLPVLVWRLSKASMSAPIIFSYAVWPLALWSIMLYSMSLHREENMIIKQTIEQLPQNITLYAEPMVAYFIWQHRDVKVLYSDMHSFRLNIYELPKRRCAFVFTQNWQRAAFKKHWPYWAKMGHYEMLSDSFSSSHNPAGIAIQYVE